MSPEGAFSAVLEQYGQSVSVHYGGGAAGIPCRAFLQPVRERKEAELPGPLGYVRQDRWLYLGGAETPLEGLGRDGYILWHGQKYEALRAQPVYVGEQVNHWWAILRPRDREAE